MILLINKSYGFALGSLDFSVTTVHQMFGQQAGDDIRFIVPSGGDKTFHPVHSRHHQHIGISPVSFNDLGFL